jgi:type II secretory pathway component PulM
VKDFLSKFSSREKTIVTLAAVSLIGLLIHASILEPFNQKQLELNDALEQGIIDLKWMQTAVVKLPRDNILSRAIEFEGSLANLIDKEVRSQDLNSFLTQMTPISNDEIRVRYKGINFNRLLDFIARVNSQGLKVKDLRINATDQLADVDCSLVLEKTGN